jgi:hypothetical protein
MVENELLSDTFYSSLCFFILICHAQERADMHYRGSEIVFNKLEMEMLDKHGMKEI